MKHYFRIATILPVKNLEGGITSHAFKVWSVKNGRRFTFTVFNTGYSLSMIREGSIVQFESRTNLYRKKQGSTILFEVRPNLKTFTERDILYRRVTEGKETFMIEPPNILTFPIEYMDIDKRRKKKSRLGKAIHISINKTLPTDFIHPII